MTIEKFIQYCNENPMASLSTAAYSVLYDAILKGELKAGVKLNLAQIAENFGLSRTPVADACDELVRDKFLYKNEMTRGYYVTKLHVSDYNQMVCVRRALEIAAVSAATRIHNVQHMAEMRKLAEEFQLCFLGKTKRNPSEVREMDLSFHKLVFQSSKNPYLTDCYLQTMRSLQRYLYHFEAERSQKSSCYEAIAYEHLSICNAIESGIPFVAEQAMAAHMDTVAQIYNFE